MEILEKFVGFTEKYREKWRLNDNDNGSTVDFRIISNVSLFWVTHFEIAVGLI